MAETPASNHDKPSPWMNRRAQSLTAEIIERHASPEIGGNNECQRMSPGIAPMPVELTIDHRKFRFETDPVRIGRAAENEICLPEDHRVAPYHAVLRQVSGQWIIQSSDGGPVCIEDGRPVRLAWLNSGDVVRLTEAGPDLLFVLMKSAPPKSAPIPPVRPPAVPTAPARRMDKAAPPPSAKSRTGAPESASPSVAPAVLLFGTILTLGLAAGLAIVFVGWKNSSQLNRHVEQAEAQAPTLPVLVPNEATNVDEANEVKKTAIDPSEYLILVGIGDLRSDNRPHVLGVGWLWDERTAVIPRTLGDALSELVAFAESKGSPRQACVIQGIAFEVDKITSPPRCQKISVLRLKEAAALPARADDICRHVTAIDVERMRVHGKTFNSLSFAPFPKSPNISGTHGFSLTAYDPEFVHIHSNVARLLYEQHTHVLIDADPAVRIERGGLLVDTDHKIVGMTVLDSTVVWTDCLEAALEAP